MVRLDQLFGIVCYSNSQRTHQICIPLQFLYHKLRFSFVLGNYKLYMLTSQGQYQLRVDLEDFELNKAFAKYSQFSVAGPMDDYRLMLSGFSGSQNPRLSKYYTPCDLTVAFSHGMGGWVDGWMAEGSALTV